MSLRRKTSLRNRLGFFAGPECGKAVAPEAPEVETTNRIDSQWIRCETCAYFAHPFGMTHLMRGRGRAGASARPVQIIRIPVDSGIESVILFVSAANETADKEPNRDRPMKTKVDVEVRERFESTPERPLWRAIVTTVRGRCYACTFAGDKPTEEYVRHVWQDDRKSFDPYFS